MRRNYDRRRAVYEMRRAEGPVTTQRRSNRQRLCLRQTSLSHVRRCCRGNIGCLGNVQHCTASLSSGVFHGSLDFRFGYEQRYDIYARIISIFCNPRMPISKVLIYRLLFVCACVFVVLYCSTFELAPTWKKKKFVFCICTVMDLSAEDKAGGVKFCTAVHRRPRQGISHFCELCSPRSPKSDESASAQATPTRT